MDAIMSIISYLSPAIAIFLSLLVIFFVAFIALYGEEFIPVMKHKRNRFWSLVWVGLCLFTAGIVMIPRVMDEIPEALSPLHSFNILMNKTQYTITYTTYELIQTIVLLMFILYSMNYIYNCRGNSFFAGKFIKKYERKIDAGCLMEISEQIEKCPWYFLRAADKNAFYLLKGKYYSHLYDPIRTIHSLNKINPELLYDKRFEDYSVRLAAAYADTCNFSKAKHIIKRLEDMESAKQNPEYWNLKCFLEDISGNLKNAEECAKQGLNVVAEDNHYVKCQLCNNLARNYSLRLDLENAILYMRWALKAYRKLDGADMPLCHVIYGNLILMLIRRDSGDPEIEELRAEYQKLVEANDSIENSVQYQNVILEMFRQSGINNYYNLVMKGYKDITEKMKKKYGEKVTLERISNEISTLRILINGNFTLEGIMKDVTNHFRYYRELEKSKKIVIYQELHSGIELMHPYWQVKFQKIYTEIDQYYHADGLKEVDAVIAGLDEYDVFGYVNWTRRKNYIVRAVYGKKFYDHAAEVHQAIIKRCGAEGVLKEELREKMLWLDEMTSPEVWDGYSEKPQLVMDNAKMVDEAAELYDQFREYPEVFEFTVLLSALYFILDNMEKSKFYLDEFHKTNVDIHSYAAWYRSKFYHLCQIHGKDEWIDREDFRRVCEVHAGSVWAKDVRLGNV